MRVAMGAPMTQSNVTIQQWAPRIGGQAWAVVLAGGKGMRLRGLTRHVYGEDRPKQYAVLTGGTSLLRQTLDRVRLCIPPERTVVVSMAGQGGYMRAELRHEPRPPHVLEQPTDRGTAAAILLAAHWIQARDPEASMMVLPSDHFVSDDGMFMDRVAGALEAIACHPEQIVLLGAEPSEPETDYGWIELGERLTEAGPALSIASGASWKSRIRRRQTPCTGPTRSGTRSCSEAAWRAYRHRPRMPAPVARAPRRTRSLPADGARALGHRPGLRVRTPGQLLARIARALSGEAHRHATGGGGVVRPGDIARVIRTLDELGIKPDWLATLQEAG
jgi:Mannose-1-phosphate guanylyltransferase